MANSSPDPRSLVQRLHDPEFVRRDVPGWPRGLLRLLDQIGDSGGPAAIPHVLSLLTDEDKRIADAAEVATASILSRLSPDDLVGLDAVVRHEWAYLVLYQRGWPLLTPETWVRELDGGRLSPALVGLASMHPSGFVREAAIRRLAERTDGTEVPYLLIRLNDWVEEGVRAERPREVKKTIMKSITSEVRMQLLEVAASPFPSPPATEEPGQWNNDDVA